MTTSALTSSVKKRSISPSVTAPKAKAKKINDDVQDEFDVAVDGLDEDALVAAAEAVEEAASATHSSPPSSAPSTNKISSSLPTNTMVKPGQGSALTPLKSQPAKEPLSDLLSLERETMAADWFQRLEPEMKKPYFVELKRFLAGENAARRVTFPPPHLVHSWSRLTPIEQVKVVVVGQDPYHGSGQACGLSFSVPKGVPVPPSLKNIYKELATEYPGQFKAPSHGCLDGWAKQGVLLLNASLTVSAGQAGSHHGKGWEKLTKHVLKLIADQAAHASGPSSKAKATANSQIANMFAKVSAKQAQDKPHVEHNDENVDAVKKGDDADKEQSSPCKGVVFLAWGAPAAKTLTEAGVSERSPNVLILRSPHPSPLSAHRGFLGNGHFLAANKWLEQQYGPGGGIDWSRL